MPQPKKIVEITPESREITVEDFLTAQQVADRLHVKRPTIYEWARGRYVARPLPRHRLSRKVLLFRWSEVVRWIENTGRAA